MPVKVRAQYPHDWPTDWFTVEAQEENQRLRQLKGKKILHMGGGGGQQYSAPR